MSEEDEAIQDEDHFHHNVWVVMRFRKVKNLNELSVLSGVSESTLGNMKARGSKMNVSTIRKIALALNVPVGLLIGEKLPDDISDLPALRIHEVTNALSEEGQRHAFDYLEFLADKYRK